jgi:hypothetical protein
MPGAYAHITLVNLAREPARLEAGPGMPDAAALALSRWFKFCELGAVSPDYPYLVLSSTANRWADLMHYDATGAMVQVGTEIVRQLSGVEQEKALAWLLGYAAHVITDATIHPVVELKVGPYAQNKRHHRVCEMNQDAYIFQRLNLGEVGLSEHLSSGIAMCGQTNGELDSAVASTWSRMLQTCHPGEFGTNQPDIAAWHRGFALMVNKIAEEGNHLMPIARHVAVDCGLTYPAADQIERGEYIDALTTPHGVLPYDQVFEKALTHVIEGWHLIGEAVYEGNGQYQTAFGDWDLDTGRDETGQIVLWA